MTRRGGGGGGVISKNYGDGESLLPSHDATDGKSSAEPICHSPVSGKVNPKRLLKAPLSSPSLKKDDQMFACPGVTCGRAAPT